MIDDNDYYDSCCSDKYNHVRYGKSQIYILFGLTEMY